MPKPYIVVESGLFKITVFYLKDLLTIGRETENDICLNDPSVSDEHAVVLYIGEQAIIQDMNSRNGTFVNGERIEKAAITHNDNLQCGNVQFQFVEDALPLEHLPAVDIRKDQGKKAPSPSGQKAPSKSSSRLVEAISQIPLFKDLDEEGLSKVAAKARLMVFDQGQTVVRQGDIGTSLYIVLDGKVRIFTDMKGKMVPIKVLSDSQFFGEMSFLTGAPRTATVKAADNSYLCELNSEALREIIYQYPTIKATLVKYYQERLSEMQKEKEAAGVEDNRNNPRFNITLPVHFAISSPPQISEKFKGQIFRCLSTDISFTGVRIKIQDDELSQLPVGCHLRMGVALPHPWESIRCAGILKNLMQGEEGQSYDFMGVEFVKLSQSQSNRLKQFLFG